jgi:hypothetical protein
VVATGVAARGRVRNSFGNRSIDAPVVPSLS